KAALARGAFPCIGSTTLDEYRKYIEADPAMERRFVKILIAEPEDDACIAILRGAAPLYEQHHGVRVSDDGIAAAVQLASRFMHDRKLPGKAIDLLDLAMSRARRSDLRVVRREEVAHVCADVAKVPIERVLLDDAARFLQMESALQQKVVGHENVIGRVAESIRRNYAGFVTHRPMGSFLFLGSTGVGKTELAKAMADFLFGSADTLIRLDMSEFAEPHTVARLVGAPPGYVGHQDGGQLTEAIRRRPHCVVLLDEIEKAHADILPLLLQILDEGRLTDSKGRTVTFRHAVVVMTSNLGAPEKRKASRRVGFGAPQDASEGDVDVSAALESAKQHFSPELWGRIEDKLVFAPLSRGQLSKIAGLLLASSSRNLETTRSISLVWDDAVLGALIDEAGEGQEGGARHMRRAIQRLVESPLSEAILRKEVREGDKVRLRESSGRILARRIAT
ncbi:MAG: AAA family ATPase, partial [Myxococcota bacterium]